MSENRHRIANDFAGICGKIKTIETHDPNTRSKLDAVVEHIVRLGKIQKGLACSFDLNDKLSEKKSAAVIKKTFEDITNTICNQYANKATVKINVTTAPIDKNKSTLINFCAFELVNNACKHVFRQNNTKPKISVDLKEESGMLKLLVTNNGAGMYPELFDQHKAFCYDKLRGSEGLKIIRKITQLANGRLYIVTSERIYESDQKLGDTFKMLSKYGILQTHRSYAVNIQKIKSWDGIPTSCLIIKTWQKK